MMEFLDLQWLLILVMLAALFVGGFFGSVYLLRGIRTLRARHFVNLSTGDVLEDDGTVARAEGVKWVRLGVSILIVVLVICAVCIAVSTVVAGT